jgi:hypothetical protein
MAVVTGEVARARMFLPQAGASWAGIRGYLCFPKHIQGCQLLFGTLGTLECRQGVFRGKTRLKQGCRKWLAYLTGTVFDVLVGLFRGWNSGNRQAGQLGSQDVGAMSAVKVQVAQWI